MTTLKDAGGGTKRPVRTGFARQSMEDIEILDQGPSTSYIPRCLKADLRAVPYS
jgi:hypothetical protein